MRISSPKTMLTMWSAHSRRKEKQSTGRRRVATRLCRRVRHVNDKKKPDHWRIALDKQTYLARSPLRRKRQDDRLIHMHSMVLASYGDKVGSRTSGRAPIDLGASSVVFCV